ncbi:uncharacterized protein A1O9_06632 [Exophiala aquamarina CBS 119918]|uniref:Uncharacterized protein n=1 Tax=Exophiala aquamarina CBS 119918 TaxID=1182545 RepID=A0A072PFS9_9EURO|nr:uncharacterized protein A1O9_06632 [Exophiala aquamarina CBS 119918]KEF58706.1 hypothetical protein A1O9_06632 [Exophiala aquamarina CBS 119918]
MSAKVRSLTTVSTYSLAHTAQCKLKLSAKRGDRDLRFILGHAFTLDNVMLRIMEIENQTAKSSFLEGKAPGDDGNAHYDCTAAKPVEPEEHYDCTKAAPPPPPEPEEHYDCTKPTPTPAEPDSRGRRISFRDNNARPSRTSGVASNNRGTNSPARRHSPPPVSFSAKQDYLDDSDSEGTSSDDYDEPDAYQYDGAAASASGEVKATKQRPVHDEYSDEEDAALEFADDELDPLGDNMGDLSLTRFESASARPPRMIRSTSSSSDEDDDGPLSPPQLPADVDVRELMEGEKDEELEGLYDGVRRCRCHGQREDHEIAAKPQGIWDIPSEKSGGKRLAVVAVAA